MRKIYAITQGGYSGYHIVALTADMETAEKILDACKRSSDYFGNAKIEEYEDAVRYDNINPVWECAMVFGTIEVETAGFTIVEADERLSHQKLNEVRDNGHGRYWCYVSAPDEETAKKIACDLIAKYKAEKAGIV